ncbi:MAG: glycosyl transferase family protein [Polymorphobacter sp.]|uniref:glycosyl transferase family protein n=1 Tax=Polymorphobacter sp. TaxID=1909290 RepID=UPI003A870F7C
MTEALLLAQLLLAEAALLTALLFLLSGLDDLFIDGVYFARSLWRRLTVYRRHPRADVQSLIGRTPAAPIAIFVPAWDESAVIGDMLRHLTATLDYPDYRVFIGLYPNDPKGQAIVTALAAHDSRLQAVRCARPGPTSKADCLNHIWAAATRHEARTGRRFKAIVLHDAEDVVHPHELHIHNALIPGLSLVQLPVRPLADPASPWIAGHYLDEFAEAHAKDLVVREALGAAVPSAGVASGLCRETLGRIAAQRRGGPFDATSLTEDYEIGHRVHGLGRRSAMVRLKSRGEAVSVATAEHFPATLSAAVAQKSRWLTGIALAGWDRLGWPPGLATRYMLYRDRKAILTALLALLGYALALGFVALALIRRLVPGAEALPPPVAPGSPLAWLLAANLAIFGWRLAMRALFTARAHGLAQGLMAIPRSLTSNLVNALAALAAIRRYRQLRASSTPPVWGKTLHRFPANPA